MSDEKVKVLYIGGYSRSGSTIFLRMLGQIDGFFSVGELWDIWDRSFAENQLCGCGQPFRSCEFWSEVVREAFGGLHNVDVVGLQALRASVQGKPHIPQLMFPFLRTKHYQAQLAEYTQVLSTLYRTIKKVSGCRTIVDSSKVPTYAFLLNEIPEIDLDVLHLIRDSRAVAYSWQRKKVRPEIHWKTAYMDQYNPMRSSVEWALMNTMLQGLHYTKANYMPVRYEDLVSQPESTLLRIAEHLGEDWSAVDFFGSDHTLQLGVDHTVSGNPNRFQKGEVKIRPDTEWRHKMSQRQKYLVAACTWPLLWKYGYALQNEHRLPATGETEHQDASAELIAAELMASGRAAAQSRQVGPDNSLRGGPEGRNGKSSAARLPENRPLRILQVVARYLPSAGGTEIHTYEVSRRLAAEGHHVTVLTTDADGRLQSLEESEGVQIVRVRAWPAGRDYFLAPGIYQVVTEGEWDVIHIQGGHTLVAPLGMAAAWKAGIPYVVSFHSGGHSSRFRTALRGVQWTLLRPFLARAERLIGVSKFEADFFQGQLRLPRERFAIIPGGSYLPKVNEPVPLDAESTLIVSVGRLERYKGHHRVISALPKVIQHYPNVRLRIVGAGPYESALRRLAEELGVADKVEIRGIPVADRQGMATLLLGAKLFILLSDYESQGLSVYEALALGRPVLVADTSNLRELARRGLVRATSLGSTPDEVATEILMQLREPLVPGKVDLPTWEACAQDSLALYRSIARRLPCAS